jgi:hypothetical protein
MPRSHEELDLWARDHELLHAREKIERTRENEVLIDAIKLHVKTSLEPLAGVPAKLDALAKVNDEQLAIAKESAEERGRRKQREDDAAAQKSADQLEIERLKLEADKIDKAAQRRADVWKIVTGVVVAIATAIIAYLSVKK